MNYNEIVVAGNLLSDGTLELDEKPNLAPGRVTVVLRKTIDPEAAKPRENWWQFMQNARKKMEDAGCQFMDEKEIAAHIDWLREGDRIDDLLREMDNERHKTEQP